MIPIIAIILMALVGLVISILAGADNTNKKLSRQLELGNKYLNEEDYERAIAAFDEALDIDPKCAEAYLGLADAYVGLGDMDEAKNILINGIDMFESYGMKNEADILSDKLETINEETQDITDSEPSFEVHDVKGTWMEIGKSYDYKTITSGDEKYDAIGTVMPLKYEIVSDYDGIPAEEGYEWRVLDLVCWFDNRDYAYWYGVTLGTASEDFYDSKLHDSTASDWEKHDDYRQYTVLYNGIEYFTYEKKTFEWTNFMLTNQCLITDAVMVPKGYDGCVFGLYDKAIEWKEGLYFYDIADDNSLMFRMSDNIGEITNTVSYIDVDLSAAEPLPDGFDENEAEMIYDVYVGLDSTRDYENSTLHCPNGTEDEFGVWISREAFERKYEDYRIDNLQIKDGLIVIGYNVGLSFGTSSGISADARGVVLDINRGIAYSFFNLKREHLDYIVDYIYGEYNGALNIGRSSYPIIYEPDGGIVLSKNVHEDFYMY